jgi:flagellar hook-basal body complex protein FliE
MSALPAITVSPDQAIRAYRSVEQGSTGASSDGAAASAPDFGAVLGQALQGVVATGKAADAQAMSAIAGGGDLTSAVTALSKADLALQTTVAIRDRVVQAYQDILKMPI